MSKKKLDDVGLDKKLKRRAKSYYLATYVPTLQTCNTIEILTSVGLGVHAVAADLRVSHDRIESWRKEYPEIRRAFQVGRMKRQKRAYACFYSQAFPVDSQGKPTHKGDAALMIFWMKTREKWKEAAKDINLNSKDAPTLTFALKKEISEQEFDNDRQDKATRKRKPKTKSAVKKRKTK